MPDNDTKLAVGGIPLNKLLLAIAGLVGVSVIVTFTILALFHPTVSPERQRALAEAGRGPEFNAWTIEPGVGIGELRFGMTAKQVTELLGPNEGSGELLEYFSLGLTINLDPQTRTVDTFLLGCPTCLPDDPLVRACVFRFANGVGTGTSGEEIFARMGPPHHADSPGPNGPSRLYYPQLGAVIAVFQGRVIAMSLEPPPPILAG